MNGGVGLNNTNYLTIGAKLPLNPKQNLFLSTDGVFTYKKFKYTFFERNDYTYKSKRYGLNVGIDFLPSLGEKLKNLRLGMGFKLGPTFYRSALETNSSYLKEILLNKVQRDNVEIRFLLHIQYNFNKGSGVFIRHELRGREYTLLHNPLTFVGYVYQFRKTKNE